MPKAKLPPNAIHPKTRAEWRAWLEQHHTQTEGGLVGQLQESDGQGAL
jgi:hypothetical protein